ncbi:Hypothetical predicted protein [Drosophila guanche]|uniref:Uncharacterized protein n=1 Tax=Drosophila guanche TaxID=7266 RepID=A0A3B0J389_DROGU|nr:Hypothetical predicted protein [Drosophila guanche]
MSFVEYYYFISFLLIFFILLRAYVCPTHNWKCLCCLAYGRESGELTPFYPSPSNPSSLYPMFTEFWFFAILLSIVLWLVGRECYMFVKLKVEEWNIQVYERILREEMMLRLAIEDVFYICLLILLVSFLCYKSKAKQNSMLRDNSVTEVAMVLYVSVCLGWFLIVIIVAVLVHVCCLCARHKSQPTRQQGRTRYRGPGPDPGAGAGPVRVLQSYRIDPPGASTADREGQQQKQKQRPAEFRSIQKQFMQMAHIHCRLSNMSDQLHYFELGILLVIFVLIVYLPLRKYVARKCSQPRPAPVSTPMSRFSASYPSSSLSWTGPAPLAKIGAKMPAVAPYLVFFFLAFISCAVTFCCLRFCMWACYEAWRTGPEPGRRRARTRRGRLTEFLDHSYIPVNSMVKGVGRLLCSVLAGYSSASIVCGLDTEMDLFIVYVGAFFVLFLVMPIVYFLMQFLLWFILNKCCGSNPPQRSQDQRHRRPRRRVANIVRSHMHRQEVLFCSRTEWYLQPKDRRDGHVLCTL